MLVDKEGEVVIIVYIQLLKYILLSSAHRWGKREREIERVRATQRETVQ